ncbi:MAG: hypothetical protein L0Y71_02595 [Gemmataceae bacterium]|nr:hypothetical protein [Gemmataceae bacterium]
MNCEHCQEQLLHYLYDVVEPEERAQLAQHLESCAPCQAARDALRAQQDLLAEAAKESFAEVSFQVPAETPKRFAEPTQALPRRQRGFSWVRVAVAASIFVFVFGGGTMGTWGWFRTKDKIEVAEAKVRESRKQQEEYQQNLQNHRRETAEEIKAIQEEIDRLFKDWSRDASQERKRVVNKPNVRVQAPASPAAGARIPVNIDVTNLQTTPPVRPLPIPAATVKSKKTLMAPLATARAKLTVTDQVTQKELYSLDVPNVQARNHIQVPPLPLTRDTRPELQVELFDNHGQLVAKHEVGLTAVEYLTHLMTDRPMYRPGEVVRFRSLTLERFSLKPAQEDLHLVYRVLGPNQQEIFKVDGAATLVAAPEQQAQPFQQQQREPIKGPDGQPLRGLGAGEYPLDPNAPGGQYTLIVSDAQDRFAPEKRTFLVNQWQMPRMNKELKFHRSSYGPGDVVEIHALAKRAEGGAALANQPVHVRATVDNRVIHEARLMTKQDGSVPRTVFPLPAAENMPFGQGSVTVEFHDGAGPESIVKPIPIVLNKLHVEFFAEGGDLIQGVANRVYFQATNTLGRPAELKGRVVDQQGNVVARVETFHDDLEEGINQGQGSFTFVPAPGQRYELKIDAPIGIKSRHLLPPVMPKGIVLHLTKPLVDDAIDMEITSADAQRPLMVGAYCRGKLLDQRHIGAPAGRTIPVTLQAEPGVSGVYRITVYEVVVKGEDVHYVPRAERLTFRKNTEHLKVTLDGAKDEYFPGERVEFKLRSQNEQKQKTPAVGLVSVVDLSLIKLADDKTDRGLPTHFLLTNEIRKPEDFENADVLLGSHPKAAQALDLLLGTQGWRRFAEQNPLQNNEPEVARVVTAWAQPNARRETVDDIVAAKVDRAYAGKAVKIMEVLAKKEAVENGPPDAAQQLHILQINAEMASRARENAQASLRDYEKRMFQYLMGALVLGALAFGLGAIALGIRRLGQGRSALASLVTGTALLLFLFMGSLAGVFYMIGKREDPMVAMHKAAKDMPPPAANAALPAPDVVMVAPKAEAKAMPAAPPAPGAIEPGMFEMAKKDRAVGDAKDGAPPPPAMRGKGQDDEKRAFAPQKLAAGGAAPPRFAQNAIPGIGPGGALPGVPAPQPQFPGGFGNANPNQALLQQLDANQLEAQMRADAFGGPRGNFHMFAERELRQQRNYQEIMRRRLNRNIDLPVQPPPLVVREYAHRHADPLDNVRAGADAVRRDFTETVFWQPALILPGGEAQVAFDLSDSVTRYQVTVFSHSLDGRLGADRYEIAARLPFSIDPKVPFEISNTDKVIIPVAVKNDTKNEGRVELSATVWGLKSQDPQTRDVEVGPNERNRGLFAYESAVVSGQAQLRVKGTMNFNQHGSDTVEREFKIVAEGYPLRGSVSGLLEKAAAHDVTLPNTWVPGTLQCQVQVFPSTLAELQKGLEGLLREPHGCFEQSSSSNYPNVLILNYLQEAGQADPNLETRARGLMQSGYQKLTSFECINPKDTAKRGYEWFGRTAPPHEALTAYGLLQFHDMAKVYNVDKDMVERTRTYLLGQRDGQGGFKRNARAIDTFGRAPEHITNAYIVWGLTNAGAPEDLSNELAALYARAKGSNDPYFIALVALGHLGSGKTNEALALAKALKDNQKDDGRLDGTQTSITGSQGRSLQLETTALCVLAWLKANRPDEFHANVEKAVKWINAQRSGQGSFGATQSTILALKALIAHTRDSKKIAEDGQLSVKLLNVNKRPIAETAYTAGASEPITLALLEANGLRPGQNKVLIETTGRNTFPYTLSWSYQTLTPPADPNCPVKLSARLGKLTAQEGETVKLHATVENQVDKGHGMTVAILGLPAGLSIPEDAKQLKDLARLRDNDTKPGVISHWELRGRELVLYWRDLAPKAKIDVAIDLMCRLPGTYRGPASRAYLYYDPDHKNWIEPLAIAIDPQRVE